MLIANEVWTDEWFCSLPQRLKLLYLYLLGNCSKCGVFELNMRRINFDLSNCNERVQPYTADEILKFAGKRIQPIGSNKAIIVKYIQFNWVRDKPLDPSRNPLHRGLANELAKYGLTFEAVDEMAKTIRTKWYEPSVDASEAERQDDLELVAEENNKAIRKDMEAKFEDFWKAYPSECQRKVDKKKCREKFIKILTDANDATAIFDEIMDGLDIWKQSSLWKSEGGKYIRAPLVWLNNNSWEDNPRKETANGNTNRGASANANYKATAEADIGW